MKTKIYKALFFIVTLFVIAPVTDIYGQKERPYNYYPKEYDNLTSENWKEMKVRLDNFLNLQSTDTFSKMENPSDARFLLTRMAYISWDSTYKTEVITYLGNFAQTMLEEKSFIKNFSAIDMSVRRPLNSPLFMPHRAVWTVIQLDENAACTLVRSLFRNIFSMQNNSYLIRIREMISVSLSEKYKSDSIIVCLKQIGNMPNIILTKNEQEIIADAILKHDIYVEDDQRNAWQTVWEKIVQKDLQDIIIKSNQIIFNRNIAFMKEIYGDLDIPILLGLSEQTTVLAKQYFFLYNACYIMNGQLSLPETAMDRTLTDRLVRDVQNLYENEALAGAIREQQGIDFLNETFTVTKKHLEK